MHWGAAVSFLTGFFIFLYGITRLSSEMQQVVGSRFREYLERATKRPLCGAGIGAAVTALIQSSSATTVIVVGMVNAGMLNLYQSIGIIFGANIGTTITAQFVAFRVTEIAPLLISAGFLMMLLMHGKYRLWGSALFYFGLLFFGLSLMGAAVAPLRQDPILLSFMAHLDNPAFAFLLAAGFTALVQSSSVTTSMVVVLGMQGLLSLGMAIPMILGANIGTTITALLVSAGMGSNARRAAVSHLLFNIAGVAMFLPFISGFQSLLLLTSGEVVKQIANAHTIFNVLTTLVMLSIAKPFADLIAWLIPSEEKEIKFGTIYLNRKLTFSSVLALDLVAKELGHEMEIAVDMVKDAMKVVYGKKRSLISRVQQSEHAVNNLQREITRFLVGASKRRMADYDANRVSSYLMMVNDIERIGDLATNLLEVGEHMIDEKLSFSKKATAELKGIERETLRNLKDAKLLLEKFDAGKRKSISEREKRVDGLAELAHERHIERLEKGTCNTGAGVVFMDLLANLERICDHANNIARRSEEIARFAG